LSASWRKLGGCTRSFPKRMFLSKNWFKTRKRLAKGCERLKGFRCGLFFKLGVLLAEGYGVLILEDLDTMGFIERGGARSRKRRVYDASLSGLRGCLEWVFGKRGKTGFGGASL